MAFHQPPDFATNSGQAQFASRLSPPSAIQDRKGSMSAGSSTFARIQHDWSQVNTNSKQADENMNDLAMSSGTPLTSTHFKHESGWSPHEQTSSFNQTTDFEPLIAEYAVHGAQANMNMSYDPSAPAAQNVPHSATGPNNVTVMQPPNSFSISPSSQAWASTSVPEGFDCSPLAPQGTRTTPVFATSTSILRRDGIRKKNARFEIPAERNLRTIDQLIAQTSDEAEIKELKQQKRLLRNRQAALDSRQRKKQHTERLEEEKKQYTNLLSEIDDELNAMKMREAEWVRQRDELMQNNNRLHQWCQQLQTDKEESLRAHTVESGQLRKENSMLLEQLQRVDAASLSASNSAGIPADFSDFEQLTIHGSPWENFPMQSGFSMDNQINSDSTAASGNKENHPNRKEDRSPASGLLLMLLLCGAWLVSRGSAGDSEILPSVPDDLRAASATVIEDLYKGTGIKLPGHEVGTNADVVGVLDERELSHTQFTDQLAGQLSHAFSMEGVTAQATQMSNTELFDAPGSHSIGADPSDSVQVGQIMREAIRTSHESSGRSLSATESYSKSLLIDKVPSQVLKDFASMVSRSRVSSKQSNMLDHNAHAEYD